jgi:hypothetical protein
MNIVYTLLNSNEVASLAFSTGAANRREIDENSDQSRIEAKTEPKPTLQTEF